jgi:zinc D-Ala-D-Ala dipeptidase
MKVRLSGIKKWMLIKNKGIYKIYKICLWFCIWSLLMSQTALSEKNALPSGFVRLSEVAPSIQQDIRYFGSDNFMGHPVRGYQAAECIVTTQTAEALAKVQKDVQTKGYSLKVYDCYRPKQAVAHFVQWAKERKEQRMKNWFYPKIPKEALFTQGYIAEYSGHSRGSTVDITLVSLLPSKKHKKFAIKAKMNCLHPTQFRFQDNSLDMGTAFDCFDPMSHTDSLMISAKAKMNRLLLKQAMENQGFKNLPEEWWHYTLFPEPFPERYFNFEIR